MSIKKVKLTETDLNRIVNKVIQEQGVIQNAVSTLNRGAAQARPQTAAPKAPVNSKVSALAAYLKQNKITPSEINAAVTMNKGAVRPQQGTRPTAPAPQKQGGFISNAVDTVKQGIQKGVDVVQGLEKQGINKLSQGIQSVANAVKPQQKGGVANAANLTPEQLKRMSQQGR